MTPVDKYPKILLVCLLVGLVCIVLAVAGCGESVSERSARDYAIDEQRSTEHRLRSLEERVTNLEGR